ncbi:MAG: 3-deoxy-manno-octulosonate cytidylyltransferase [Thermodesulfovibrionales bacterium]|nr:3-deoxy-manno-octulosonate cytidylyltransferase [Thermodesulfovibrionales bacterium]
MNERAVVIIPARYGATRFPGKPLALLKDKPIIQWVFERARCAKRIQDVIVATDDERIVEVIKNAGGKAVMTSKHHASGTDRIAEVAKDIMCDIIINVQGDEPFISPDIIDKTIELLNDRRASISTMAKIIEEPGEIKDPNVVKVVLDREGFALYFSRSVIPFYRDKWRSLEEINFESGMKVYKHIGIYGYRRDVLLGLSQTPQGELEKTEKLEQLRALENGMRIKVGITTVNTIGIDTPQDLKKAEEWLNLYS